MIKTKEDLKFYLKEDAKRNGMECSWIKYSLLRICGSESANIYHWITHYRRWEYHFNNNSIFHKIVGKYHEIMTKRIGLQLGIRAEINKIGYGLRIIHIGGGIHLSVNSIGNYCGFNSGVIIGNNGKNGDRPTIGNNVAFGPGAKAFGNISIGNNTFVAANAVVTRSFPENCIIGGVPAKILKT